jgi:hypothetical protein
LKLGRAGLRSGLLSYWPETNDVAFRLEVQTPRGSIAKSAAAQAPVVEKKPSPFEDPNAVKGPPPRRPKTAARARITPPPQVAAKPGKRPAWRRVIGKIPLVRRLNGRERGEGR